MQKRREFVKTLTRGVIFTSLVSVSSYLVLRERDTESVCDFDFVCRNCKKLNKCSIPEARDYKKENELKEKPAQNG